MIPVPASADPAAAVTPAASGGAISADTSAGAPGQAWTSLGPITISEGAPNEIDDGVFVLTIPAGFEFNVASAPDVAITGATPELAANSPAVITATTITVTVTDNSTTEADTMIIGGVTPIQVRPTAGTPLAGGNITMTAGIIAGVTGATNFGTLNEVAGAVATLTIVVQPSDALVGIAIAPPVQIKAVDQFNNSIAGQNIAVALQAGTGTLSGTSPRVTDASGIATFNDLSIDTAGPAKMLRFSADGTAVDSNLFNITFVGITVNPTTGLVTTEAGGSDNFTMVLGSQPSDNVTIALSSNDLSEGTVSSASLTFTNTNWNTPQTVTVTGVDDFNADGNVAYTIVTAPAASTDPNYNGLDASDVTVTNTDDDVATATTNTATGAGTATFATSSGAISGLTALAQSSLACTGNPGVTFPHGFFSFNITGITPGSTVTITITLPSAMPVGTQYWKCQGGMWVNCTSLLGSNDGDNIITLTIKDGGLGDGDGVANGTIVDPGGPAIAVATATQTVQPAPRSSPAPPRPLSPAQMSVKYLSVSPQQTVAGQPVTVTTNVVNTGYEAGSYNVTLKVNGQVEESRMVSVGAQGTQPVKFTVTKAQPGTYTVSVGDQKVSFVVTGAGSSPSAGMGKGLLFVAATAIIVILVGFLIVIARRRLQGY
jgi:hypothetical protein